MSDALEPISRQLGLSFRYDWSNPAMPIDTLIGHVLVRGIFEDMCRVCIVYGLARVNAIAHGLAEFEEPTSGLKRKLRNIELGFRDDGPHCFLNIVGQPQQFALGSSVIGQDGHFAMKSHLLSQRARSRDLFDLQTLMAEQGYRLEDVLEAGVQADAAFSKEYAKSVLVGDTPLDQEDEGFASIGLKTSLQSIYEFFTEHVNQYERALAKQLKQGNAPK